MLPATDRNRRYTNIRRPQRNDQSDYVVEPPSVSIKSVRVIKAPLSSANSAVTSPNLAELKAEKSGLPTYGSSFPSVSAEGPSPCWRSGSIFATFFFLQDSIRAAISVFLILSSGQKFPQRTPNYRDGFRSCAVGAASAESAIARIRPKTLVER